MSTDGQIATESFTLGPVDAGRAVLLLHGFTGSPWEVRPLGESLAARGFHVHAPRLPGHGLTPEELLHVNADDWKRAAFNAFDALTGFSQVYVAGLSMGGLLSVLIAAERQVSRIVLMAPVFGLRPVSGRLLKRMQGLPRTLFENRWVKKDGSDIEDLQAQRDNPVLSRYPVVRLFDLFALQDEAHRALPKVRSQVLIAAAEQDHVVQLERVRAAASSLSARLVLLKRGYHILPRDTDRALLAAEVAEFLEAPRADPQ
jgi:carboxylesterase